jgi:uncharacterized protein YecE (DUF72 family)
MGAIRVISKQNPRPRDTPTRTPREIAGLARRVLTLGRDARYVYAIANNHARDFAPKMALALAALLKRQR